MDKESIKGEVFRMFGSEGEFVLDPLPGDASTRRFYRLRAKDKSIILMKLQEDPPEGELPFINIQRYLLGCGVKVPKIYLYKREEGLLFIEDLGDRTLERVVEEEGDAIPDLYRRAIDTLIHLQKVTKANPDPGCIAYGRAFDVPKLMEELDIFLKYLPILYRIKIEESDLERIREDFYLISRIIAGEERIFCHRDYHSRNLLLHDGCMKMVDFQDARLGPPQYDLASLLFDSYVVLPPSLREELLIYYLNKTEEKDVEGFRFIFDYTAIQRNLKACGTFAYLKIEKGKDGYISYIPDTLRYVSTNLSKYKELHRLKDLLEAHLGRVMEGNVRFDI
jgi:hypothetical protein